MTKINKKILLLVVEDEKTLVRLLEEKLIAEGFSVDTANDGDEGLKLALKEHPDLILLDILMPKVDGLTMLKELRKDAWGKHAPVIILTNVDNTAKIAEGMKTGLDGMFEYMIKTDWPIDSVVARIKQRLGINN